MPKVVRRKNSVKKSVKKSLREKSFEGGGGDYDFSHFQKNVLKRGWEDQWVDDESRDFLEKLKKDKKDGKVVSLDLKCPSSTFPPLSILQIMKRTFKLFANIRQMHFTGFVCNVNDFFTFLSSLENLPQHLESLVFENVLWYKNHPSGKEAILAPPNDVCAFLSFLSLEIFKGKPLQIRWVQKEREIFSISPEAETTTRFPKPNPRTSISEKDILELPQVLQNQEAIPKKYPRHESWDSVESMDSQSITKKTRRRPSVGRVSAGIIED
jgi:hypothetical protein